MTDNDQEDQFPGAELPTDPTGGESESLPDETAPESAEEQLPAAPDLGKRINGDSNRGRHPAPAGKIWTKTT